MRSRRRSVHPVRTTVENDRPKRNVEQAEADDDKPHHRARTKRNFQPGVERFARRICRARARVSRRFHAEETGETGEETARQKRHGNDGILQTVHGEHGEKNRERHEDDPDDFVLLF